MARPWDGLYYIGFGGSLPQFGEWFGGMSVFAATCQWLRHDLPRFGNIMFEVRAWHTLPEKGINCTCFWMYQALSCRRQRASLFVYFTKTREEQSLFFYVCDPQQIRRAWFWTVCNTDQKKMDRAFLAQSEANYGGWAECRTRSSGCALSMCWRLIQSFQ